MLIYKNKLQICSFVNLPVLTSPTKVTISFNANTNHLIAVSSFYQLIQFMLTGNCLFVGYRHQQMPFGYSGQRALLELINALSAIFPEYFLVFGYMDKLVSILLMIFCQLSKIFSIFDEFQNSRCARSEPCTLHNKFNKGNLHHS